MKSGDLALVLARVVAVTLAACGSDSKNDTTTPVTPDPIDGGQIPLEGGAKLDANPDDPCAPRLIDPPDASDMCGDFVRYPCGLPQGITPARQCFLTVNDCASICPDVHYSCTVYTTNCDPDAGDDASAVVPDSDGGLIVDCSICKGVAGRRPAGLARATTTAASPLGAWLAQTAHLEAASVHAFRRLAKELTAHGAPASLIDACQAAVADEIRHARDVGRLARRFGGRFAKPRVAPLGPRSFEAIVRENAIEGCVRETFAAVVAEWQAKHALPEIAGVFARIAEDETRHAALAWSIAEWAMPQLDPAVRASIVAECREVIATLDQTDDAPGAGLPDASARRLLAGIFDDLLPILSAAVGPNETIRSGNASSAATASA